MDTLMQPRWLFDEGDIYVVTSFNSCGSVASFCPDGANLTPLKTTAVFGIPFIGAWLRRISTAEPAASARTAFPLHASTTSVRNEGSVQDPRAGSCPMSAPLRRTIQRCAHGAGICVAIYERLINHPVSNQSRLILRVFRWHFTGVRKQWRGLSPRARILTARSALA